MSEMPTWHPVVNKYVQKCTCPPEGDLSNKHYSRCPISTRAWATGWLGGWLAGWLAGWPAGWLAGRLAGWLGPKCVKNA